MIKTPLLGRTLAELETLVLSLGLKRFRAKQIHDWIYSKLETDPARFTNLSKDDRAKLSEVVFSGIPPVVAVQSSPSGDTQKVLYAVGPGAAAVEAVLMTHEDRTPTFCISTQAGCGMGCSFCATGKMGLVRNLSEAEIAGQVVDLRRRLRDMGLSPVSHTVVYMGMGEPLANLPGTLGSIQMLHDPERFGLSARRITVSTIGLVTGIEKLTELGIPVNLAVSLHAPDAELRAEIMPVTGRTPLDQLLQATNDYFKSTGRRITLEYILLAGVNDDRDRALALAREARRFQALVNLIPYNEVEGIEYRRPSRQEVGCFRRWVIEAGAQVTVRWSQGGGVQAACGQLATRQPGNQPGK
jgi:23S rRNA (adenine2503-C2)-methyltransferase